MITAPFTFDKVWDYAIDRWNEAIDLSRAEGDHEAAQFLYNMTDYQILKEFAPTLDDFNMDEDGQ